MAQHSLKQRIQKDKLLQHSYYCIEELMGSGGVNRTWQQRFQHLVRTNKTGGRGGVCIRLRFDLTMLIGIQIGPIGCNRNLLLRNDNKYYYQREERKEKPFILFLQIMIDNIITCTPISWIFISAYWKTRWGCAPNFDINSLVESFANPSDRWILVL